MKKTKATPEEAHELAGQEREKDKLLELYNGGLPYDRRLIISQVKALSENAFTTIVEIGKRLLLLKEFEGHGGFIKALEEIGLEYRMAHNMVLVAQKLSNVKALSNLGKSKLYLIANNLTAEEVAEAEKAGAFDKYEGISYRQLQTELRKRDAEKKEKKDAQGRLIDKLNKEVERLKKESETAKLGLPDDEEAMEKALQVELLKFDGVVAMLGTVDGTSLSPRMLTKYIGALEYINKYSLLEMLKAKQEYGDPLEQIFDGDIDEAEAIKVGGGWER